MIPSAIETAASAAPPDPGTASLVIHGGGTIGYVIIGCSIIGVGLVIDAALALRRARLLPPDVTAVLEERLSRRDVAGAVEAARQSPGVLAPILAAGLERADRGLGAAEEAASAVAEETTLRLSGRIGWIALIAGTAPLLGLYGTVWGMMEAFATIEKLAAPRPSELAEGIKIALVTTFQGLTVAIPLSAAAYALKSRLSSLMLDATSKVGALLDRAVP